MENENWILARKPLSEKSIADNVLKWGTGGINIDGSRIEISDDDIEINTKKASKNYIGVKPFGNSNVKGSALIPNDQGRFPANFIYSGDDEVLEEFGKAGVTKTTANKNYKFNKISSVSEIFNGRGTYTPREDEGTPARFFYNTKE